MRFVVRLKPPTLVLDIKRLGYWRPIVGIVFGNQRIWWRLGDWGNYHARINYK